MSNIFPKAASPLHHRASIPVFIVVRGGRGSCQHDASSSTTTCRPPCLCRMTPPSPPTTTAALPGSDAVFCSCRLSTARSAAVAMRTSDATRHVFWSRAKKRFFYYQMRSTMKVFIAVIILSLASFAMGQSRSGQTPAQVAYDQAKEQQSKASVAAAAAQMLFDSITSEATRLKQDMQKSQSDAAMWKAQCESDSNAHLAASVAHERFKNVTRNVTRAEQELAVVQQLRKKLQQVTFTALSRKLCFCHVTKLDTFLLSATFSSPTSKLCKHRTFRLTATSTLSNVPFLMHPPKCVRQPLSCSPISWHSSAAEGTSPKRDKLAS